MATKNSAVMGSGGTVATLERRYMDTLRHLGTLEGCASRATRRLALHPEDRVRVATYLRAAGDRDVARYRTDLAHARYLNRMGKLANGG